jgi:hypothetical protein
VKHSGAFTEFVPLVEASDDQPAGFRAELDTPARTGRNATSIKIGGRGVTVWRIDAQDTLQYSLRFVH